MLLSNKPSKTFVYRKHPWQKWLLFTAGVLQVIVLLLNLQEYNEIASIKDNIYTAAEWELYTLQQSFQISLKSAFAVICLGCFLIGIFSRSKKAARIAEGLLLLLLAVAWGSIGVMFQFTSVNGIKFIWFSLLLLTFFGSLYTLYKSRKMH